MRAEPDLGSTLLEAGMSESESEAKILSSGRSLQSVRFRYSSTAEEPIGLKCILNKSVDQAAPTGPEVPRRWK